MLSVLFPAVRATAFAACAAAVMTTSGCKGPVASGDVSPDALDAGGEGSDGGDGRTALDRTQAQQLIQSARVTRDAGNVAAAKDLLDEALAKDPGAADAHIEWAFTGELLGLDAQQIDNHYSTGARLAPSDARAQLLAGAWAERRGDVEAAAALYERAVKADPKHVDALCRSGNLALARGDVALAAARFQVAAQVAPSYPPALLGAVASAERRGDVDGAVRAAKALIAAQPAVAQHHSRLIAILERAGRTQEAKAAKAELDRLHPRDKRRMRRLR